jgi:DNA end-binding protein Ku
MAARAIASGVISFGLVSIPVKLFTAASSEQVRFNYLDPRHGIRVKQQYYSPVDNQVVERSSLVKGYEYARGKFVTFTDEELKALEAERSNNLDIVEFVPKDTLDFVQVEKSYYLGADKGGDKAYRLLSESMERKQKVAVGRWGARGKEQLVAIRPYRGGLILHQLFYHDEVRAFEEIDDTATFAFSDKERDLAERLIDQLSSDEFVPERYHDEYADRVRAAVDQKVAGEEITISPEEPRAQIIDLFEALKRSLNETETAAEKTKPSRKDKSPTVKKARPTGRKPQPAKKAG